VNEAGLNKEEKVKKEKERSVEKLKVAVLANPKLAGASPEHLKKLEGQLGDEPFSNDQLMAGAKLIAALDGSFPFDTKKVYFYREGLNSWPVGFVNTKFQAGV